MCSRFNLRYSLARRRSCRNNCSTSIPVSVSWMKPFTADTAARTRRNAGRTRRRKIHPAVKSAGTAAKVTSASCQFIQSSAAMMPTSSTTSVMIITTPELSSSFSASTSLVARVTTLPIGFRSNQPVWSFWMWSNTSRRMSRITRCPNRFTIHACP